MTRRIPLEDFFRKPERAAVRLSPSGRWLAWMAPYERRLNVFVRDLEGRGEAVRVTSATERDVAGYVWANDERIVYAQDRAGDENHRLYAVGRDGSDPIDLTPFDEVKCGIVDDLEEVEGEILFQMNHRVKEVFDVYRIDVATGEMRCVAENPGNIQSWLTDHFGRVRVATTTDGVKTSLLFRETEADDWSVVGTFSFKETVAPLFFTFDDERLYVSSNLGRDKAAILEYDPRTGAELELIFEHSDVDAGTLLASKRFKTITGGARASSASSTSGCPATRTGWSRTRATSVATWSTRAATGRAARTGCSTCPKERTVTACGSSTCSIPRPGWRRRSWPRCGRSGTRAATA